MPAPDIESEVTVGSEVVGVGWLVCNISMTAVLVKSGVAVTTMTTGVGELK